MPAIAPSRGDGKPLGLIGTLTQTIVLGVSVLLPVVCLVAPPTASDSALMYIPMAFFAWTVGCMGLSNVSKRMRYIAMWPLTFGCVAGGILQTIRALTG